ncbi:hypothetical protein K474DRAFT_1641640 [Panus rudis PR-1116 ss-1]|nr:hypothetical protein K474DRAFT_1641640 [Panus rudis PR-1116 ss-1]
MAQRAEATVQQPEASEPAHIDPSKLTFESPWTRRRIIACYWAVIILALPLWWKLTSIERLALPEAQVKSIAAKKWQPRVHIRAQSNTASDSAQTLLQAVSTQLAARGVAVSPVTAKPAGEDAYEVVITSGGETGATLRGHQATFTIPNKSSFGSCKDPADILSDLLAPPTHCVSGPSNRVVKYAPRYRLAFTLLNEDAASGNAAFSWDVLRSIDRFIQPTLDRLNVLHNFTIESQVQYQAPLAFSPVPIENREQQVHGLTQEQLTVFVNSAEWTLSSSVSNDPVLHFVLFIPSAKHKPLSILDHAGQPSDANAFILPQWGGIVLLNNPHTHLSSANLLPTFTTFRQQLMALLGVPDLPACVRSADKNSPFTDWQLDALVRRRTAENVKDSQETLQSIVSLVNQIENMPVGQDVRGDVQGALDALNQIFAVESPTLALQHSAEALKLSSRAFFNPGMLGLLYFPAEHKYAVYTPLFASVAAPLVAAVVREFMAWKRARKEAQKKLQAGSSDKPKED